VSRSHTETRTTKETDITVSLAFDAKHDVSVDTTVPFFDHMLHAFAFHGGFSLSVKATGDTNVDPHHLVEDTGLVIGECLRTIFASSGGVMRFGHAIIPMDEALSEATIDVCGRPTLAYRASFPQDYAGEFPLWLFREFFLALANRAEVALHLECRYGENAHHMIEALFKALGKAIGQAYAPIEGSAAAMSTKGAI
jgi:imidazoleglycerol-phosphate dehydratase